MTAALARFLAGLSGRERGLILLAALVVLPLGLALAVVQPMLERRDWAAREVAEAAALRDWLSLRQQELAMLPAIDTRAGPAAVAPTGLSGIEARLSDAGLRPYTTHLSNPSGGTIALRLESAPFAALMPWLQGVEHGAGYRVATLRLMRGDAPGLVEAEIQLEPAG